MDQGRGAEIMYPDLYKGFKSQARGSKKGMIHLWLDLMEGL